MSLLLAIAGGASPDVTSTLAFTTDDFQFAGTATETITSTLAFTTDDVVFAGVATETISGTLALTADDLAFDGIATETITSTLALVTDDVTVAVVAAVTVNGTFAFTTDDIEFGGNIAIDEVAQPVQEEITYAPKRKTRAPNFAPRPEASQPKVETKTPEVKKPDEEKIEAKKPNINRLRVVNSLIQADAMLALTQYGQRSAAGKQQETVRSEEIRLLIMYNIRARAALLAA